MIIRTWKGCTPPENANRYEDLLRTEIFPGIRSKNIAGLRGIELLRKDNETEAEFMTIFRFDNLDSVRQLAGENYRTAYVPESARKVLSRFAPQAQHYEVRDVG